MRARCTTRATGASGRSTIDIHTDEGRALLLELGREVDVVIENYRPGVMDRVGLGYDDFRAVNPDVIYASLTGFGPVGPYAHKGAYDTVIQAYGGFAANQKELDADEPKFLKQTAADKITALYASQAITAALFARERGDGGQHVQLAMLDAVASFLWADAAGNEVLMDSDGTQPSSFVATFRPLKFADGWGIVTPTADKDFPAMCRAFGVDDTDPRLQTIRDRNANREFVAEVMDTVYAIAETTDGRRRDGGTRAGDGALRRGALDRRAARGPARGRGGHVRDPRPPAVGPGPPPAPPRAVRGDPGDARRAARRCWASTPTRCSPSSGSTPTGSRRCGSQASSAEARPSGQTRARRTLRASSPRRPCPISNSTGWPSLSRWPATSRPVWCTKRSVPVPWSMNPKPRLVSKNLM